MESEVKDAGRYLERLDDCSLRPADYKAGALKQEEENEGKNNEKADILLEPAWLLLLRAEKRFPNPPCDCALP